MSYFHKVSRLNCLALRFLCAGRVGVCAALLATLSGVAHATAMGSELMSAASAASASAAGHAGSSGVDDASLPLVEGLPFAGMLLSIALFPIVAPHFWHRHFGKVSAFWGLAYLLPFAWSYGAGAAASSLVHAFFSEYLPFIVLLTALYTVAGGICVRGNLHGSPAINTLMLAIGTLLASVMGTTGAAMLMIRPLLRANDNRKHRVHVVVFFIFLVANAGGSLTPLGDPPLFLGFLNGVGFMWTIVHLFWPMVFVCSILLAVFYALDAWYFHRREEAGKPFLDPTPDSRLIWFEGKRNVFLIAIVTGLVLLSGVWRPGVSFDMMGTPVELQNLVRDGLLIAVTLVSLWITPKSAREGNAFNWAPIAEVAKLFAAIFVTIAPVIAILRAGEHGALASVVHLVASPSGEPLDPMYFWVTGLLSSFLDNAPTYLVFFNLAGGDAQHLMTDGASTLVAISAGAVFMGANTYIGNAPNFMVKAMAESRGVKMPGFFAYMLWSGAILLPLFCLMTVVFFR
jgi:Na+/H+ antiporter NhaD/arsenite permease-like protein